MSAGRRIEQSAFDCEVEALAHNGERAVRLHPGAAINDSVQERYDVTPSHFSYSHVPQRWQNIPVTDPLVFAPAAFAGFRVAFQVLLGESRNGLLGVGFASCINPVRGHIDAVS
jgi:hypothetical protein